MVVYFSYVSGFEGVEEVGFYGWEGCMGQD